MLFVIQFFDVYKFSFITEVSPISLRWNNPIMCQDALTIHIDFRSFLKTSVEHLIIAEKLAKST